MQHSKQVAENQMTVPLQVRRHVKWSFIPGGRRTGYARQWRQSGKNHAAARTAPLCGKGAHLCLRGELFDARAAEATDAFDKDIKVVIINAND